MIKTDSKEDKLDFLDNDIQLVRDKRTTNKPRLKGNHKVLQNNVGDNAQYSKSHSDLGREKLSMNPYNLSCLYHKGNTITRLCNILRFFTVLKTEWLLTNVCQ